MGKNPDAPEADTLGKLNKVYLTIISRYRDYIEEHENVSIAELPTLVTPKNGAVVAKVDEIKASFGRYDYDNNFYDASLAAFSFVKEKVEDATLPLQFWLTPEETLAFMIGDTFDRCVLLCSMMVALGNPSAKVAVVVNGESRKLLVYYEFGDAVHTFDLRGGLEKFASKEEMVASLKIKEDTTAYEFNDLTYTGIS